MAAKVDNLACGRIALQYRVVGPALFGLGRSMTALVSKLHRLWAASPSIGERCGGRDNNFNLVRMIAAYAVLISHSFPLALGRGAVDPVKPWIHMTLGELAVDVFFVTSGFLIARSLEMTTDLRSFARARVLRIFPALLVVVALTVLVLGPVFTAFPIVLYLTALDTWLYALRTATLVTGVAHMLPGVFVENPYPRLVNASLWTLPYELFMYFTLGALWWLSSKVGSKRIPSFSVLVWLVAAILMLLQIGSIGKLESNLLRLASAFLVGSAIYFARQSIRLNGYLALTALLALASLAVFAPHEYTFRVAYLLVMPYLLFAVVFLPGGPIRAYNTLGDYSYGTYVYAFPVQQAVAAILPSATVGSLMAWSTVVTLACAVVSWHAFEKRALAMKRPAIG